MEVARGFVMQSVMPGLVLQEFESDVLIPEDQSIRPSQKALGTPHWLEA